MKRLALTVALLAGTVVGCLQGIGDRCQVDTDCANNDKGIVCNKALNTCQSANGGSVDASIPDAPIDAPPDASDAGSGSGS